MRDDQERGNEVSQLVDIDGARLGGDKDAFVT
jgi:hypothetical protein